MKVRKLSFEDEVQAIIAEQRDIDLRCNIKPSSGDTAREMAIRIWAKRRTGKQLCEALAAVLSLFVAQQNSLHASLWEIYTRIEPTKPRERKDKWKRPLAKIEGTAKA